MPGQLAKRDKAAGDVVAWHDAIDGGARGVIARHVSQPHIIDVSKDGRFDIYFLDKRDKPKHVTSGKAGNVTTAKSKATAQALANIKELKDAVQADIIDAKASPVQRREQPAWLVTAKVFVALCLFVFAFLLFSRWLLLHRPVIFVRWASWALASVFGAWQIMRFFDHLSQKRERLTKRKVIEQALASKKGKKA